MYYMKGLGAEEYADSGSGEGAPRPRAATNEQWVDALFGDLLSPSEVRTVASMPPKSQSEIAGIIKSIGAGVGQVLSAQQQAKLQSQLLAASRSGRPVYLPQSSPWGTVGLVVGGLALVVGAAILLAGRGKRKTA